MKPDIVQEIQDVLDKYNAEITASDHWGDTLKLVKMFV